MSNMMAVVDGRIQPPLARLQHFAPEMHTLLRATLNVLNSTRFERCAAEEMLIKIIRETLDTIESAQEAPTAPQSLHQAS